MAEKKQETMVQTTLRIEKETLYRARLALNLRGLSVAKYLTQKLEEVVQEAEASSQNTLKHPSTPREDQC